MKRRAKWNRDSIISGLTGAVALTGLVMFVVYLGFSQFAIMDRYWMFIFPFIIGCPIAGFCFGFIESNRSRQDGPDQ